MTSQDLTTLQKAQNSITIVYMKEPIYKSTRFWVSVLTPIVSAAFVTAVEHFPFLSVISSDKVVAILAGFIVMMVSYVAARTVRNSS